MLKVALGVDPVRFRGEKAQRLISVFFEELVKRFVVMYFKVPLVVKSRAFELFVVDLKPHRLYDVQRRARAVASAGDVAGILRNFRLHKHNIYLRQPYHPAINSFSANIYSF